MLNVVRMPSCSFMEYNTYITWKHWEKNFGPTFQVRPKICIWPPDYDKLIPGTARQIWKGNAGILQQKAVHSAVKGRADTRYTNPNKSRPAYEHA